MNDDGMDLPSATESDISSQLTLSHIPSGAVVLPLRQVHAAFPLLQMPAKAQ